MDCCDEFFDMYQEKMISGSKIRLVLRAYDELLPVLGPKVIHFRAVWTVALSA
jgi:hypothetical protein